MVVDGGTLTPFNINFVGLIVVVVRSGARVVVGFCVVVVVVVIQVDGIRVRCA
jgi:hypothetical protein